MNVNGIINVKAHTMQAFRIQLEPSFTNGHDFVELLIDETHNTFTARLYGGEVYTHVFGAPGGSFIKFLIRTFKNDDYLFSKLADHSMDEFIDTEKSAEIMKKKIIGTRRNHECTPEEARKAWEFVESLEEYTNPSKELFYQIYSTDGMGDIFEDEFWYEDTIISTEDRKCRVFCELVAPILSDFLAEQYAESFTPYGGRTTVMADLPVGTKFHVCNGVWNGRIEMVDGKKVIRTGSASTVPVEDCPTLDIKIIEGEG